MNDTDLRLNALAHAVSIAQQTGNYENILATAETYFQFLKGSDS